MGGRPTDGPHERASPPQSLSSFPSDEDLRKWKEAIVEIQAKGHEKAAAYTNLIMIAGYASAFTLWNFTREELSNRASAAIALLLGFSIVVFVVFEIYKMRYIAGDAMKRAAILSASQPIPQMLTRLQAHEAQQNLSVLRRFMPLWNAMFWASVVPGFIAAGLLFYSFFATLLCLPQWP